MLIRLRCTSLVPHPAFNHVQHLASFQGGSATEREYVANEQGSLGTRLQHLQAISRESCIVSDRKLAGGLGMRLLVAWERGCYFAMSMECGELKAGDLYAHV